jgi:hypothetical protein
VLLKSSQGVSLATLLSDSVYDAESMADGWRSRILPADFTIISASLLPPESDTKLGPHWAQWRNDCAILIAALGIDMIKKGDPPTFGSLCRALQLPSSDITERLVVMTQRNDSENYEDAGAQIILSRPLWFQEILFPLLAEVARAYEDCQDRAQ